jgi:uncharacterized protein (TIGR03066 family)
MKQLLIILSTLFIIGCGSNHKEDILGKWQSSESKMELFKDGTVSIDKKGTSFSGTYAVLEENRLKMTLAVMGMEMTRVATFKLSDSELVLTSEDDGKVTNFSRLK